MVTYIGHDLYIKATCTFGYLSTDDRLNGNDKPQKYYCDKLKLNRKIGRSGHQPVGFIVQSVTFLGEIIEI